MKYRKLGNTEEKLSAIGLGCMGMSFAYGPTDDAQSLKTLEHALEIGINFLDTADMYGVGHNEKLLSNILKGHRNQIFLATKFGFRSKNGKTFTSDSPSIYFDGRPAYVKEACEASLQRLGIDTIDLYYSHRVDPNVPIEETVGAMGELVREGKVRYIGISEASVASLRKAHAEHPITALQSEYSLFTREVEEDILPVCRELGIGFVPYSPLGRGMLTAAIKDVPQDASDFRKQLPRFQEGNFDQNKKIVEELTQIANRKGCTPAQLALAWLLAQGEDIIPIPGTKKIKYLDENVGAVDVELTADELEQINASVGVSAVSGNRYADAHLRWVNH